VAAFERATELNPNAPDWRFTWALVFAGQAKRAVEIAKAHMRVDPFYSPLAAGWLGFAHYFLKQYSEAVPWLRECTTRAPNLRGGHLWSAATYARIGQLETAKFHAAEALRVQPGWTIDLHGRGINHFKFTEHAEHYFGGLRMAGLPERGR